MATIEERAGEFVMAQIVKRENGKEINVGEYKSRIKDVTELLTDQDRIARAEERERCIKAAQDAICAPCTFVDECRKKGRHCKTFIILTIALEGEKKNDTRRIQKNGRRTRQAAWRYQVHHAIPILPRRRERIHAGIIQKRNI